MGPARRADLIKLYFRTHSLILRIGMIKCICPGWSRYPIAPPAVSGSQGTRAGPPVGCRRAGINNARGRAARGREYRSPHLAHISGSPGAPRAPGARRGGRRGPHIYEGPGIRNAAHAPSNRSMRRDFRELAYIYICTGPASVCQMAGFR